MTEQQPNDAAPTPKYPPGSARAKLAAFDRKRNEGVALRRRLLFLSAVMIVMAIAAWAFWNVSLTKDVAWFDIPKDASYLIREGKWDELEKMIAEDLVVEGIDGLQGRDAFIAMLQARGRDGLAVFATHPHAFGEFAEDRWLQCFVTWARGDLQRKNTVPLVETWYLKLDIRRGEDKTWEVFRAFVSRTLPADGGIDMGKLLDDDEEGR